MQNYQYYAFHVSGDEIRIQFRYSEINKNGLNLKCMWSANKFEMVSIMIFENSIEVLNIQLCQAYK